MKSPRPLESIRERFTADHRRLEALLEKLLAAFEANDREDVASLWTQFEGGLLAHLEAEEKYMIPALLRISERDARVIIGEHKHIRSRLAELSPGIDLHIVRLASARDFIDELRAHAQNEDRLLYDWADTHVPDEQRASAMQALSATAHAAPRALRRSA